MCVCGRHTEDQAPADRPGDAVCAVCGEDIPGTPADPTWDTICDDCELDNWDHAALNEYGNPITPPLYEDGTVAVPPGRDWNPADTRYPVRPRPADDDERNR